MNRDDEIRLRHMLEAAQDVLDFMHGNTQTDLKTNRLLFLGTVKAVEIIGEAASKISPELREQHSQIPWEQMTGMRHILVHAYYAVDITKVWETVTEPIPLLVEQRRQILPEQKEPPT